MSNSPQVKHYNRYSPEPIELINRYNLGFNLGNVFKYLTRAGTKENTPYRDDLEKTRDYLRFECVYNSPFDTFDTHKFVYKDLIKELKASPSWNLEDKPVLEYIFNEDVTTLEKIRYIEKLM